MVDSAKTGENARWRSRTARAHPIFDICDLTLRSNFLKFQILSPLLPLNLWLNFENLTHCPFKSSEGVSLENYDRPTNKQMNFMVHWEFTLSIRVGSGSGFFLDPDPDPVEKKNLDPDPDPVCY